jgi:hypothetical protein
MASWTSISAFVLDQVFGYQTANKLRENDQALLSFRLERQLGGSREQGVQGSGSLDPPEFRQVQLDSTNLSGLSIRARVETKTNNAGTSVQPKIRNVTDSTDTVTGSSHTNTTFTEELLAISVVAGTKKYQLQLVTNNANNPVFGFGHIESYL